MQTNGRGSRRGRFRKIGLYVLGAIVFTASSVGAEPLTGESSGVFYLTGFTHDGRVFTSFEYATVTAGHSTLTGAEQCSGTVQYRATTGPPQHCAATDFEVSLPNLKPGHIVCQNEDTRSILAAQIIPGESYGCLPPECFDRDGYQVDGCQMRTHTTYEIEYGTGIYENSVGSFTVAGISTHDTFITGSIEADTVGDITLAGDTPPDDIFLDIPGGGSTQSGIGVVSGWSCLGGHLEVEFSEADGTPIFTDPLSHGAYRPTTQDICGDTDNGFSIPMNWGRLGPGEKTLTVFVNGEERITQNFFVTTFGEEFVTDAGGTCEIVDLRDGQNATFVWQQGNQGLVLEESLN